jgi:hypothetical protein
MLGKPGLLSRGLFRGSQGLLSGNTFNGSRALFSGGLFGESWRLVSQGLFEGSRGLLCEGSWWILSGGLGKDSLAISPMDLRRDYPGFCQIALCGYAPQHSGHLGGLPGGFLCDPQCCPLLSLSSGLLSGLFLFLQQLKSFLALLDDFSHPH